MFFLKIFDDREKELELPRDNYKSPLAQHLRWCAWATDEEGITGEVLLDFININLLPKLKTITAGGDIARLIRSVFEDANNYMKDGTLMRQVINKINGINFNASDDRCWNRGCAVLSGAERNTMRRARFAIRSKAGATASTGATHTRNTVSMASRHLSRVSGAVRSPAATSTREGKLAACGLRTSARTCSPAASN